MPITLTSREMQGWRPESTGNDLSALHARMVAQSRGKRRVANIFVGMELCTELQLLSASTRAVALMTCTGTAITTQTPLRVPSELKRSRVINSTCHVLVHNELVSQTRRRWAMMHVVVTCTLMLRSRKCKISVLTRCPQSHTSTDVGQQEVRYQPCQLDFLSFTVPLHVRNWTLLHQPKPRTSGTCPPQALFSSAACGSNSTTPESARLGCTCYTDASPTGNTASAAATDRPTHMKSRRRFAHEPTPSAISHRICI